MVLKPSIVARFEDQAEACDELGSPFTARLCRLAARRLGSADGQVFAIIDDWPDDRIRPDALALRFCGALHALKRRGNGLLSGVYPPAQASDDSLWQVVSQAMSEEAGFMVERMQSAPQTNEVRRSAALFPAFALIAARFPGMPLVLSEIGASAGLNLMWDRYAYHLGDRHFAPAVGTAPFEITPDWRGPPPAEAAITVSERAGCDLNPLDAAKHQDCERLLSYIWADQTDRLERTEKALALARDTALQVEKADAVEWLETRLSARRPGKVHIIYHTIAWQYLGFSARAEGTRLLEDAGARADENAPLCHLAMEADGEKPGACLTLTIWPGGQPVKLGRADFHGRWIDWRGLDQ